ncbi:MAG: adenylate/guanylate cyclase domain-containing protein [Desulfobacterales bacterium]
MISSEHFDSKWLTSVELFETTGISRATLNNYIKMGIIPKPIVRKPDDPASRAKKIGYFSPVVVDSILAVQRMKKEGISMENIVDILTGKNVSAQSGKIKNDQHEIKESVLPNQYREYVAPADNPDVFNRYDSGIKMQEGLLLNLSISDIKCPAFLINNNFEIVWINTEAEKNVFNLDIKLIKDSSERNIFKLFSRTGLLSKDRGINDIVYYLMRFVKDKIPINSICKLYNNILENEVIFLEKVYERIKSFSEDSTNSTYLKLDHINGKQLTSYHAFHMVFREGFLILLERKDDTFCGFDDMIANNTRTTHELNKDSSPPSLISFSVLVADLNDSSRICAELPPEEYFELINDIWKCMYQVFKKYYGIYGNHTGVGMVCYFLKEDNSNYVLNSIYCALELKEKIKQINMEWKTRKGWANDLYLNIGINEGREYFLNTPSPNKEFTALGDTVNFASLLSDMSSSGVIWTTKNLMNKIDMEQRKTLRFGIRRMDQDLEIFGESLFVRVMDMLPSDNPECSKYIDIATISITEIISASSY